MAKIKMRNARAPSEGVPEPEKVEEAKAATGGTVDVTVNVHGAGEMSQVERDMIGLITDRIRRPSIFEQLQAGSGRARGGIVRASVDPSILDDLQFRPPRDSNSGTVTGRTVNRLHSASFPVQAFNADRAMAGLTEAAEQIGRSFGTSSESALASLESFARAMEPSRAISPEEFISLVDARTIAVDPAEPGSDRTVMGLRMLVDDALRPGEMVISNGQRSGRSTIAQAFQDVYAARQEVSGDPRLNRLTNKFSVKSSEALRREGIDFNGPSYGGERLAPDHVRNFFAQHEGPDHIVDISGIVYWGRGQRRVCMMECEMDTPVEHRGNETRQAIVAFKLNDFRNFGIQPFAGSQQYNETIGFFVYNASRGGSL
jgi:hypothetical protein